MCGLCKLNAAALDTTVACGYNGIDQHNLGLLPPIAGIDFICSGVNSSVEYYCPPSRGLIINRVARHNADYYCPPSRGLILPFVRRLLSLRLLPPIAGIDSMPRAVSCSTAAPLPHSSIHPPHPLFAFPSPLSIQVRRLLRFKNDYKKYI